MTDRNKPEELDETALDGLQGGATTAPYGLPSGKTQSGLKSNSSPGGSAEAEEETAAIRTPPATITYTGLE